MSRFRTTSEGNIPFTAEEETARDAEEAQAVIDAARPPQIVSMAQARKALVLGGVSMASVASAIAVRPF